MQLSSNSGVGTTLRGEAEHLLAEERAQARRLVRTDLVFLRELLDLAKEIILSGQVAWSFLGQNGAEPLPHAGGLTINEPIRLSESEDEMSSYTSSISQGDLSDHSGGSHHRSK
ncbi:hypothetical protein [Yerba mate-associated circular DNA virus 1]|uniref:Uncharacterized protein n=1 Tax=Yerba mate-associated circular DNA virus 1 TaxID=2219873 RepID=A0A2Z4ELG1_9VIRU|nr:hypothetical protein QKT95_gp2 [Yerba mate-associated circular DNA virus 1]AWV57060.1 hypothetical protein [Yerba mate-associated circular DNA virus 1]AWV57070.1 hypothetical protein [Yerba mate-associated circular DNA virus 1]